MASTQPLPVIVKVHRNVKVLVRVQLYLSLDLHINETVLSSMYQIKVQYVSTTEKKTMKRKKWLTTHSIEHMHKKC